MIDDSERREVARRLRECRGGWSSGECYYAIIHALGLPDTSRDDGGRALYAALADLIEPSCDRDALLALADRMEGYARFCKERSIQVGNNLVECYADRIREAVNACESDSDAPVTVDEGKTATDAHADDNGAADGARTPSIEVIRWVNEHGGLDSVKKLVNEERRMRLYLRDIAKAIGIAEDGQIWIDAILEALGKRPAPKVLDADGAEIRVGDRLYDTDTGCGRTVRAVNDNGTVEFEGHEDRGWFTWFLTHRAPVLAADGRPLREGETAYLIDSPTAFVVDDIMTREDGTTVVHLKGGAWNLPQYLTHERPDSWERIEEDAGCTATKYNERRGTIFTTKQQVARDLVRRCKELSRKENNDE